MCERIKDMREEFNGENKWNKSSEIKAEREIGESKCKIDMENQTYQGNDIQQKINKLTEFHQWELEVI